MNISNPGLTRIGLGVTLSLFFGCASQPEKTEVNSYQAKAPMQQVAPRQLGVATPDLRPYIAIGGYQAHAVVGDYSGYPALTQFIDYMVQKHAFDREYLNGLFSQAKRKQWTLNYLNKSDQSLKSKPGKGSWTRYRAQFLDDRHISSGVSFWIKHRVALQRAAEQYSVPSEYILGIMAVETTFGSYVGNHKVIDALTTLAFDYQRRGEYFRAELENFLVMVRSEGIDPIKPMGSFAGAMGLGQFMPSSFLQWAVDFNGDGRRDLWNSEDAIGSVANYFVQHGWQSGQPVVSGIHGNVLAADTLEPGIEKQYPLSTLSQFGIAPADNCRCDYPLRLLLLRHQNKDEYLLGHPNFYVITRYNQSTHYAMAVHEMAQAIKNAYQKVAGQGSRSVSG